MSYGSIAIAGIGALMNMSTANKNRNLARTQYEDAKELRKEQQKLLDKQKAEYKAQTFVNPYKDMENTYEDLTVNTQQAEFMAKQGSQQRANIMQGFREAAGASGIAGLAQAMANQGALQTAQISANIGKQESANRLAAAKGAAATQLAERQGEQVWQATLLGMQMGEATGANQAVMQAQANQMNAQIATQQATMNFMGTLAKSGIGKQIGEGVQKEFFSGDGKE